MRYRTPHESIVAKHRRERKYPADVIHEPPRDEQYMEMRRIVQLLDEGPFEVLSICKTEPFNLPWPLSMNEYDYRLIFLIKGQEFGTLVPWQTTKELREGRVRFDERAVVGMIEFNIVRTIQDERAKSW